MQKEYFYHSFPRQKRNETLQNNLERGFLILKNIIKNGLLITPEVLELPFELEPTQKALVQFRICFTLIPNDKLQEHTDKFGQFSIEWDTQILKEMGVMPTMYMSIFDFHGQDNLKYAGPKFLSRFLTYHEEERKINEELLVNNLEVLQQLKPFNDNIKFGGDKRTQMLTKILEEIETLEIAIQISNEKKAWYEALGNLIYPVDNSEHTEEGGYYNQREWKLIGNLTNEQKFVANLPNDTQLKELLELNPGFFSAEIEYADLKLSRGQLSLFLKNYKDKHILEYANRVIVPEEYVKAVESILTDNGLSINVIAL